MKIVLTGAGGGHFYPLIAVAEHLRAEAFSHKIPLLSLYFISDKPYDVQALSDINCEFIQVPSGKLRVYPSLATITDMFRLAYGAVRAIFVLFSIYPDVVFAKGGYASVPTLFAAKLLGIPVMVHESDSVPGRTTLFASRFAVAVATSYKEVLPAYAPHPRVICTGQPIRTHLTPPVGFTKSYPTTLPRILILGGSQGSKRVNEAILEILPALLSTYEVYHQTGDANIGEILTLTTSLLKDHPHKDNYHAFGTADLRELYESSHLVISRAGSSLFETAVWKIPAIIIPIPETISRDQKSNAYTFASYGSSTVIEEINLTSSVLLSQVKHMLTKSVYEESVAACDNFAFEAGASTRIAEELIRIGQAHA